MAFNRGAAGLALAMAIEASVIGLLVFAALYAVVFHHYYATGLVLVGVAALFGLDMTRRVVVADRVLAQFLDGVMAEGAERPSAGRAGLANLDQAIGRALDRIALSAAERQRRIDYLSGLADTVAAVLLVCDQDGRIEYANLAGRAAFGALPDLSGLGAEQGARLRAMSLGAGEVLRMADGRPMLALALGFATPGGGHRRLISLQRIAGELDAVEIKAWQDLVRVLSHEMMNSLTPIASLAESCAELIDESQPQAADAMRIIARRGAGLIEFVGRYREVFDLPPPEPTAFALGGLLREIETLLTPGFAKAGAALEVSVPANELIVRADRRLLEQAILNLVKNGLDAVSDRKGGRVFLAAAAGDERIAITVSDNGPGLRPEDVETVFIPFFTRKKGGSGVGLSLVRQIAIAHNGRVEYLPGSPQGAIFRLELPAA